MAPNISLIRSSEGRASSLDNDNAINWWTTDEGWGWGGGGRIQPDRVGNSLTMERDDQWTAARSGSRPLNDYGHSKIQEGSVYSHFHTEDGEFDWAFLNEDNSIHDSSRIIKKKQNKT